MLMRVPSVDKYRRMTCLTHVHSGICPYGQRCVFLHDPRVSSVQPGLRAFPASKSTPKSANVKDVFYWPDQRKDIINDNLEPGTNLPACSQEYNIPEAFQWPSSSLHDLALYSMWNSFIDFLQGLRSEKSVPSLHSEEAERKTNTHVPSKPRLPVFVSLGVGQTPLSELTDSGEGNDKGEEKERNGAAVETLLRISSYQPMGGRARYFAKKGVRAPMEERFCHAKPSSGVLGAECQFTYQPHYQRVIGPDWFSLDLGASERANLQEIDEKQAEKKDAGE
jgi:hypothetical protein